MELRNLRVGLTYTKILPVTLLAMASEDMLWNSEWFAIRNQTPNSNARKC